MYDAARLVSAKAIYDIELKKSYSNIKIDSLFKKNKLNSIDRAFATEIIYGTLRYKLKIDYIIKTNLKNPNKKIDTWVLSCLRIGIYQLLFLNKVPDYAAVNQSVEICKIKEQRASSLVNAILRNVIRKRENYKYIYLNDKVKELSINYSHPEWIVKKLIDIYGKDFTIELMEKNNTPPPLTIRINTLKSSKDNLKQILESEGISVSQGIIDDSLRLQNFHMIESSNEFNKGLFTIQDESSMIAVRCLNPEPGDKIIDMCSAPGGKSTYIAQIMNNNGKILSFDIYEHKLNLVKQNAERLGINIIQTALKDATVHIEDYDNFADKVIADVPCSGLGLIRKKPEIRWNVNEKEILELSKIQYDILCNASKYVKINGIILYSTCTISEEENENVINKFLNDNDNFKFDSIERYLPNTFTKNVISEGSIKLFPNVNDTDGFYIARLKRIR